MNAPFKLISEPAACRFGNCVWDLVPTVYRKLITFSVYSTYTALRPEKDYSNYFDPPSDKQNANGEVYDSLPNNWRELFVFKSIYRDTAFSPWKKSLLFFASSNDNDNKNENIIRYKISLSENLVQWKQ